MASLKWTSRPATCGDATGRSRENPALALGQTAPFGNVGPLAGNVGLLVAAAPLPGSKSSHNSEQNGHTTRGVRWDAAVARAPPFAADGT